jgi:DNA topoisomerase-1
VLKKMTETLIPDDIQDVLERAELRYMTGFERGIHRERVDDTFVYTNPKGQVIDEPKQLDWLASLGIPPAWNEVWISPYKNGHILATGRDERGRKQYRYHPRWQELRGQTKFDRLAAFGRLLPTIRQTADEGLKARGLSKEKVLAIILNLLERTMIRIGNAEYTAHNETYGLTTLQDDHVSVENSKIQFEFVGKSGKAHMVNLTDKRLAKAVRAVQDIPGQELFQYYDENGERHPITSADVNTYLYDLTGENFTAKTFRTWGGSTRALRILAECESAPTKKECESQVRACVKQVAQELGNTVAVSRKYYIHPLVMEMHLEGRLKDIYDAQPEPDSPYGLRREESALIALIEAAEATSAGK